MTQRHRFWSCARRGSWRKGNCEHVPPGQTVKFLVKLFSKSLQGIKGGGAPFCAALRAAQCAMRSKKNRASQKQRSDFLAAPVHMAPPGRQKSEREFCLFGGVFLRPACRAMWQAGCSCAASRCYAGFCARCPGIFSAGASLSCSWPAGCLLLLRLVWPALPGPACWKCARASLRRIFRLSFAFSCLTSFSQTSFHLSLRPRTGIFSLVPSRGLVPGLHVLPPAAFSRAFAPIACLPAVRFVLVVCSSVCVVCVGFLSCFSSFPA